MLASAALLLWIFPTDKMTAASSAIATVAGCLMMWDILFISKALRFSSVCAFGLTMGYGFGTLNSWLTLPRAGLPLAVAVGQTVPELANGVAAALMGCAMLLLLGEIFERPLWTTGHDLRVTSGMKSLVLVNTVIIVAAFASGKVLQGGFQVASVHRAGVVAEFLQVLLMPTAIMAGVIALVEKEKIDRYLFGAIALLFLLLLFTQGRVRLVSSILIVILSARFFGFDWSKFTYKRFLFAVAGLLLLFAGVLTYQLLRVAGEDVANVSLGMEIGQVQKWEQEGRVWEIASQSSAQNLEGRTLLVTFLSSLLQHTRTETPALGKDLVLQVEWAIPSAIFPNKPSIAEEDLANRTFHVFYPDQPNSVFTGGALDFGIWGVLAYPILMMLLISAVARIALSYFSFDLAAYGGFLFLRQIIAPEVQIAGYFVDIRNFLVFSVILYIFSKVPRIQWTHATSGVN
jgi:hypothetical protein